MEILLTQNNKVISVDIIPKMVEKINTKSSPTADKHIKEYLAIKEFNLGKSYFDTSLVESVI